MLGKVLGAVALMLALGACGGANLVRKDGVSGRVDLSGPYMPAMADARVLMAEHCKGRFVAVEAEDHVEFACSADSNGVLVAHSK